MMKRRNSAIELLRILCTLMVICLHYNANGALDIVNKGSINQLWLISIESISVVAVPIFVIISAYYLCETNVRKTCKVVELIALVVLVRIGIYCLGLLTGYLLFDIKSFIISILPTNYYVILYTVLYILSPLLNIVIEGSSREQFKKNLILLFVFFSVVATLVDILELIANQSLDGLSPIGLYGSQEGYTIVNFVLLYFIGAYIRKYGIGYKTKKIVIIMAILLITIISSAYIEIYFNVDKHISWEYCSPLVIILASLFFVLFSRIKVESKIINELSKASYICFLIHWQFLRYLKFEKYVNQSLPMLIANQIIGSIVIYLISYVVYLGWYSVKKIIISNCKWRHIL